MELYQIYVPPPSIELLHGQCQFAGGNAEMILYACDSKYETSGKNARVIKLNIIFDMYLLCSGKFRVWDRRTGKVLQLRRPSAFSDVSYVTCSSSPATSFVFAYGYKNGSIEIWSGVDKK